MFEPVTIKLTLLKIHAGINTLPLCMNEVKVTKAHTQTCGIKHPRAQVHQYAHTQ